MIIYSEGTKEDQPWFQQGSLLFLWVFRGPVGIRLRGRPEGVYEEDEDLADVVGASCRPFLLLLWATQSDGPRGFDIICLILRHEHRGIWASWPGRRV